MNAYEINKITCEAEQDNQELVKAYKAYFIASAKTILTDKIYPMIDYNIKRLAKDRQYSTSFSIYMGDYFGVDDRHNTQEVAELITEHYKLQSFNVKSECYTNWGHAGSGSCNPSIHFYINWRV